ncbi:MAG: 30S ribosomal protein S15 [Parcubacteria group bacterium CG2_30_36_38]|nr:MAG: 30S ribosomal protein S15 [Parcubacteria group bacterium CG2_30_36_38]PIZ90241.1 MAG: 30S ribosomal protein S15 [bacterium (Candidatus Moisslbacteria) CG_4_10_14_0_2_um_filter_36_61]
MLKKEKKQKIINEFKQSEKDCGSVEVQIGLLTEEIKKLASHLKEYHKDQSSRLGLVKKVSQRRKFLKYLERNKPKAYKELIKKIKT